MLNRKIDLTQVQYLPALTFQFSDTFWRSGKSTLSGSVDGSVIRYYRVQGYNGEGLLPLQVLIFSFQFFSFLTPVLKLEKIVSSFKVRDPDVPGSDDEYGFQILDGKAEINTTLSRIFKQESGIFSRFKHLFGTTPAIRLHRRCTANI